MTHDQEEALSLSDRVVVMSEGRMEQVGTPFEIYNFPTTAFVASFVGTLNVLPAGVVDPGAGRLTIAGQEVRTSKAVTDVGANGRVTLALRPEGIELGEGEPGENRLHGTVEDINFLGSIVRLRVKVGDGEDGATPTVIALDAFNEPHLRLPDVDKAVTISLPAGGVLRPRGGTGRGARQLGGRRRGVTVRLDGIDLVVFDKDGTIIEFGSMWSGWAVALVEGLVEATGRPIAAPLYAMLGVDPVTGTVRAGGGLAATPMARLRDRTHEVLVASGLTTADAERALETAWHAPDPVASARPVTDLAVLFDRLRAAAAGSPWRRPTTAIRPNGRLAALGVAGRIDATVCADDGIAVKPAPDMVLHLCATLGVEPARTAVVGDTAADLRMARAAGAGLDRGRAHRRRRTSQTWRHSQTS